ncbi:hypothetical protein RB195_010729 [Necator americanus]|uniref:Uncharacterized protein n=1 Tax=Necator americanus TaxID=51031 RepID=A0ABR1CZB4_NECAM
MFVIICLISSFALAESAENESSDNSCLKVYEGLSLWLVMATTLPIIINFGTMFVIALTIYQVKQVKPLCDNLTSSTHWLSRTAVRVGIGPTAKKALVDYAKGKSEFAKLMATPT